MSKREIEMNKALYNLYERAAEFIGFDGDDSALSIINEGADIFTEYEDELPDYVAEVLGDCITHINKDFANGYEPTFDEYVDMGYGLVEDISGTLGEYFE